MSRKHRPRHKILASFTLSFGQHFGKPLKAVPMSYLRWVVASEDKLPATDVWAIREYLTAVKARRDRSPRSVNGSGDSATHEYDGNEHPAHDPRDEGPELPK